MIIIVIIVTTMIMMMIDNCRFDRHARRAGASLVALRFMKPHNNTNNTNNNNTNNNSNNDDLGGEVILELIFCREVRPEMHLLAAHGGQTDNYPQS